MITYYCSFFRKFHSKESLSLLKWCTTPFYVTTMRKTAALHIKVNRHCRFFLFYGRTEGFCCEKNRRLSYTVLVLPSEKRLIKLGYQTDGGLHICLLVPKTMPKTVRRQLPGVLCVNIYRSRDTFGNFLLVPMAFLELIGSKSGRR